MKAPFLLAFICTAPVAAQPVEQLCHGVGTDKGTVCDVSVEQLQAHPAYFDGKWVRLTGLLTTQEKPMVFNSSESLEHSITANAVALSDLDPRLEARAKKLERHWILVVGKFSKRGLVLLDYAAAGTSDRLESIESIGGAAGPWGEEEKLPPHVRP